MLDIKQTTIYLNFYYYFFTSGLVLALLSIEFLSFLSADLIFSAEHSFLSLQYINWFSLVLELSAIRSIGLYLYTYFSFFLLLAGVILLIAMIGAISLTLDLNLVTKRQVLHEQVNISPKNFMFYIK